jgi:hypothetical protein
MGIFYSTQTPTIEQFYDAFTIKFDEDVKKSINACAQNIYKKLSKSYPVTNYSLLVCYELALKQNISYDIDDDKSINKEITRTLKSLGINAKEFYNEELRIFGLYPNLCDDIGPRHPRLASEVQIENIIEEKLRRLGKKNKSKNRRSNSRHLHKSKNSKRKHKGKNSRRLKK